MKENEKPKNLILIFSNPKIDTIKSVPKHFDKIFNNVTGDNFKERQNCTGQKCIECMQCYKHDGASVIVEKTKIRN